MLPVSPARPPSGGSVWADPDGGLPWASLRLNVVPGPDANPLAAASSMLDADLSNLLSFL